VWLDRARLSAVDAEWLAPVTALTLWAAKVPNGFLPALPNLVFDFALLMHVEFGDFSPTAPRCRAAVAGRPPHSDDSEIFGPRGQAAAGQKAQRLDRSPSKLGDWLRR
jgi:hypothetical protein